MKELLRDVLVGSPLVIGIVALIWALVVLPSWVTAVGMGAVMFLLMSWAIGGSIRFWRN